jgi:hypothetical protein
LISYSHADWALARRLYDWLTSAGFIAWFDERHIGAGVPAADRLTTTIGNSRALITVISRRATASDWVAAELSRGHDESVQMSGFAFVRLRIDDIDAASAWPGLAHLSWLDVPGGDITQQVGCEILCRLQGRSRSSDVDANTKDVYVSRGTREGEAALREAVCGRLAAQEHGFRLIGDAPDHPSYSPDRVRHVARGCAGHVVVLPNRSRDGTASASDYKSFASEWGISRQFGIPQLMMCESEFVRPQALASAEVALASATELTARDLPPRVRDMLVRFCEDYAEPAGP